MSDYHRDFRRTSLAGIDRFGAPLRASQAAFAPRKLPAPPIHR